MQVKIFKGKDWNGQAKIRIDVDGKDIVVIGCLSECPEDASLERDLRFVYGIVPALKKAWEAGKRGEEFSEITLPEEE